MLKLPAACLLLNMSVVATTTADLEVLVGNSLRNMYWLGCTRAMHSHLVIHTALLWCSSKK
jgi:hypothetical protein